MTNASELKVKIFRLVDAQDSETLERLYPLLLEWLKPELEGNVLEEDEEEIRHFYADYSAFSFWEDEREDLYQDYLEKKPQ
ncbi:MAG TPA: hypothetical protein PKC76_14380 [Saprospiraceae bacterium]|nr:hypothetical protein [Saprospiraceae bacterium]HMP25318.1 hypothetical protein [Saprospiraceae bacterium]